MHYIFCVGFQKTAVFKVSFLLSVPLLLLSIVSGAAWDLGLPEAAWLTVLP